MVCPLFLLSHFCPSLAPGCFYLLPSQLAVINRMHLSGPGLLSHHQPGGERVSCSKKKKKRRTTKSQWKQTEEIKGGFVGLLILETV